MSKRYMIGAAGLSTYATLKAVFHAGETYTEEQVGEAKDDQLEDGIDVFVEVGESDEVQIAPSGRKVVVGKGKGGDDKLVI